MTNFLSELIRPTVGTGTVDYTNTASPYIDEDYYRTPLGFGRQGPAEFTSGALRSAFRVMNLCSPTTKQ